MAREFLPVWNRIGTVVCVGRDRLSVLYISQVRRFTFIVGVTGGRVVFWLSGFVGRVSLVGSVVGVLLWMSTDS